MVERHFGSQEMSLLAKALEVAEDSVSDHYQLSDASWRQYPYELLTLAQLKPEEVTHKALAQVLRLRQPPRQGHIRGKDFYRICLQDHNLKHLLKREGEWGLFPALLTYVVVHELVHVVRFYRFMHLYDSSPRERLIEEATVHKTTAEILRKVRLPHLHSVLNFYEKHSEPEWA
ncbi:MAG: hypothetical protein PVG60_00465, partial [Desulfarculaceae bacterium]